ncbi:Lrp/AsnC family transcriptional regulator [Brachybacterium alimentarium]|uniref:AsnC family transcriptional regulator n=1 Tax=Brachybacterium alimentarium TaxID=47845 RepID=A0A2A3YJD7_9MICO|nr:Lrp/AsnC ligand binding domain-containing protein [Brachybacterium alimentarium]PCC34235.1 AsnC family transcriptional regulator [Brachybacterium alimentarium]PCC39862.1 AsnC family transcriptional regulator [Brachybacterium alimentarium]RCS69832.1 Lrp/AsnC family transcriptional regulator [Brachybacterium alimentarium]RCS78592.1 Lrp/AsnC family transcriptional regulator [Brachybacterium alimentarium]RCS83844.1 Lrp/AsnC family transcriptional regulator [Brachybacterium alimentarium]
MITAIVSIVVESARIPEVAEAIVDIDGIEQVYSVTGDVDLIAVVRVRAHEDLAGVIADQLGKVEGVRDTTTNIAFKTYSKSDLDAAFDLGIEG